MARLGVKKWLALVLASILNGGFYGLTTGFGTLGLNVLGVPIEPLTFKQILAVFAVGAFKKLAPFLKRSPLPGVDESDLQTNGTGETTITKKEN